MSMKVETGQQCAWKRCLNDAVLYKNLGRLGRIPVCRSCWDELYRVRVPQQKITFEIRQVADVSTRYLTPKDLELMMDPACPLHLGNVTGSGVPREILGTFMYLIDREGVDQEADIQDMTFQLLQFGCSEQMTHIFAALRRQGIPIVRFDRDGGDVRGLKPYHDE